MCRFSCFFFILICLKCALVGDHCIVLITRKRWRCNSKLKSCFVSQLSEARDKTLAGLNGTVDFKELKGKDLSTAELVRKVEQVRSIKRLFWTSAHVAYELVFQSSFLLNELLSYFQLYSCCTHIRWCKSTNKGLNVPCGVQLEANLAQSERQSLEKELLVHQVTRLSKPLSEQADGCHQDRLRLAKKVDDHRESGMLRLTHPGKDPRYAVHLFPRSFFFF